MLEDFVLEDIGLVTYGWSGQGPLFFEFLLEFNRKEETVPPRRKRAAAVARHRFEVRCVAVDLRLKVARRSQGVGSQRIKESHVGAEEVNGTESDRKKLNPRVTSITDI